MAGSYREIAQAFHVTTVPVYKSRTAGRPIQRNGLNDLAAIAAWHRGQQSGRAGCPPDQQSLPPFPEAIHRLARETGEDGERSPADLGALNARVDRRHDRRALEPARLPRVANRGDARPGCGGHRRANPFPALLVGRLGQGFDGRSLPA